LGQYFFALLKLRLFLTMIYKILDVQSKKMCITFDKMNTTQK